MIKILTSQLIARAAYRPAGYIEDVRAAAVKIEGEAPAPSVLYIPLDKWLALRAKYGAPTRKNMLVDTDLNLIKARFEICKNCDQARDNAFACALHHSCCFGRFRADPKHDCPLEKWPAAPAQIQKEDRS